MSAPLFKPRQRVRVTDWGLANCDLAISSLVTKRGPIPGNWYTLRAVGQRMTLPGRYHESLISAAGA